MEIGTVIGSVWATKKREELQGLKFLIIQPEPQKGSLVESQTYIAVDQIGAGVGDEVMVTKGSSAANIKSDSKLPIDALVVGIIDSIDV